ncbi:hypothetical protein MPDQ_004521 [Monascus purpureus]|uniref:Uncharacterized protein n=1 Tax=Monascus purpureus TaxID=5098 RepID=A0A507QJ63_MONPU|nr:hypothetical protein MPDQ_004521 [Monascus purpureus]
MDLSQSEPVNSENNSEIPAALNTMPRRRPQPSTPPDLPTPPAGSSKKPYYVAGDEVWYCREGKSEWREGTIDSSTSSTILQT